MEGGRVARPPSPTTCRIALFHRVSCLARPQGPPADQRLGHVTTPDGPGQLLVIACDRAVSAKTNPCAASHPPRKDRDAHPPASRTRRRPRTRKSAIASGQTDNDSRTPPARAPVQPQAKAVDKAPDPPPRCLMGWRNLPPTWPTLRPLVDEPKDAKARREPSRASGSRRQRSVSSEFVPGARPAQRTKQR